MSEQLFIVRLWDGMDGTWTDVSTPCVRRAADMIWDELTKGGTEKTRFEDIDYYKVFPADTVMLYSHDREMFR